ncbi:hypothetical protein [Streptomyces zaomyceticus]|uniref:hypothetical protein n=1 Tax=Streptomyces zaomyceticus TaxID=68286 RepID=UPI0033ABEBDA
MTGRNSERGHSLFPDFNVLFGREFPGLPGWRPATAAHSIPVEMSTDGGVCVLRAELPGGHHRQGGRRCRHGECRAR